MIQIYTESPLYYSFTTALNCLSSEWPDIFSNRNGLQVSQFQRTPLQYTPSTLKPVSMYGVGGICCYWFQITRVCVWGGWGGGLLCHQFQHTPTSFQVSPQLRVGISYYFLLFIFNMHLTGRGQKFNISCIKNLIHLHWCAI